MNSVVPSDHPGCSQGSDETKTGDDNRDGDGVNEGEEVLEKSFGWGDVHHTADNSDDEEHPTFTVNPMGDRNKDKEKEKEREKERDRHTPPHTGSGTHTGTHTPSSEEEAETPFFMDNPLRSGPAPSHLPPKQEKRRRSENLHEFRITDVTLKGSGTGIGTGVGTGTGIGVGTGIGKGKGTGAVSASEVREKLEKFVNDEM